MQDNIIIGLVSIFMGIYAYFNCKDMAEQRTKVTQRFNPKVKGEIFEEYVKKTEKSIKYSSLLFIIFGIILLIIS